MKSLYLPILFGFLQIPSLYRCMGYRSNPFISQNLLKLLCKDPGVRVSRCFVYRELFVDEGRSLGIREIDLCQG